MNKCKSGLQGSTSLLFRFLRALDAVKYIRLSSLTRQLLYQNLTDYQDCPAVPFCRNKVAVNMKGQFLKIYLIDIQGEA